MTAASASAARFGRAASRVPDLVFRLGTGGFAWAWWRSSVWSRSSSSELDARSSSKFGLSFLTGTTWDPVAAIYGALPFIVGYAGLVADRDSSSPRRSAS